MIKAKEHPIVLTAQEVNAVLVGDKTQHRMPVLTNEQVAAGYKCCYGVASGQVIFTKDESDKSFVDDGYINVECPLGNISDRLWVQEMHQPLSWSFEDGEVTLLYLDGEKHCLNYLTEEELENNPNDDYLIEICDELIKRGVPIKEGTDYFDFSSRKNLPDWRTADVMPRFASRLLLEITDIRIERVQDITLGDSFKEARDGLMDFAADYWMVKHGEAAWFTNPWVWVVEFKVIESSEETNHGHN